MRRENVRIARKGAKRKGTENRRKHINAELTRRSLGSRAETEKNGYKKG